MRGSRVGTGFRVGFRLSVGHFQPLLADPPVTGDSSSFRLVNADATVVVPHLRQMLSEYGAKAELLIEKSQNRIVVRGPEAARQLAGQLIETLDKAPTGSGEPLAGGRPGQGGWLSGRSGTYRRGGRGAAKEISAVGRGAHCPGSPHFTVGRDRLTRQCTSRLPIICRASRETPWEAAPLPSCRRQRVAHRGIVCKTSPRRNLKRVCSVCGAAPWRSRPMRRARRRPSPWQRTRRGNC